MDISASIPRGNRFEALPLLRRLTNNRSVRRTAHGGRLRGLRPASDGTRCRVLGCRSMVRLSAARDDGLAVCVRCREELAAVVRTPLVPSAV